MSYMLKRKEALSGSDYHTGKTQDDRIWAKLVGQPPSGRLNTLKALILWLSTIAERYKVGTNPNTLEGFWNAITELFCQMVFSLAATNYVDCLVISSIAEKK